MTADEVIDIRNLWAKYNYGPQLPEATVLAERDWLAYVQAMAAMVPASDKIVWPTATEVAWAWPDGVVVVLAEPVDLRHTIISNDHGPVTPHLESQKLTGLAVMPSTQVAAMTEDGEPQPDVISTPVLWIGEEPEDIVSGHWLPGLVLFGSHVGGISESTRFLVSIISALGHRLTRVAEPVTQGRGERRRVARELPSLRLLQLTSGASVSKKNGSTVEWSHRWLVRGHWRQQPYGPQRKLRRMTWIDPFVKGPEDKPFDERTTIWRTG